MRRTIRLHDRAGSGSLDQGSRIIIPNIWLMTVYKPINYPLTSFLFDVLGVDDSASTIWDVNHNLPFHTCESGRSAQYFGPDWRVHRVSCHASWCEWQGHLDYNETIVKLVLLNIIIFLNSAFLTCLPSRRTDVCFRISSKWVEADGSDGSNPNWYAVLRDSEASSSPNW